MAVIATPTSHPLVPCCDNRNTEQVLTPVSCAGQNVITAPISEQNGQPLLGRMKAISVGQGQCATIDWQMVDRDGVPVNMSACDELPYKVVLRMKEQISLGNSKPVVQANATITDATEGRVRVELTQNMAGIPCIYYAEMALINVPAEEADQPCIIFSNTFYLIINRGTLGNDGRNGGPPSIAEIRLHLRDSSPSESYLL